MFQSRMPPDALTLALPCTAASISLTSDTVAPPAPNPVEVFT